MSNYGNWGKRYGQAVQAPAQTNQQTNINTQGQGFTHIDQQSVGNTQPVTGAYVAVRLTVGRAAQYGAEKLECTMEMGLPCEPTQQGRDIAFQQCVQYLNTKIPEVLHAADQTFEFENEYVRSIVKK